MKVKLLAIDAKAHSFLKSQGQSHRKFRSTLTFHVSEGQDVTGQIVRVAGNDYYVLEQFIEKQIEVAKGKRKNARSRK